MPSTYLELTNKLLRRLNEVEITQSDFVSVRGVQALAKDAIAASISTINQREFEWPFNAVQGTQTLSVGVQDYAFPNDLRSVKWDNFHIRKDDTLGNNTQILKFISRDFWDDEYKERDLDAGSIGVDLPKFVFERHGFGFSVSPSPNKPYTVCFEYFRNNVTLSNHDDTSTIPNVYDEAIIQGGLYHFYMFRDNAQQAAMAEQRFNREIEEMRTILINKEVVLRSTMIVRPTRSTPVGGYMY